MGLQLDTSIENSLCTGSKEILDSRYIEYNSVNGMSNLHALALFYDIGHSEIKLDKFYCNCSLVLVLTLEL